MNPQPKSHSDVEALRLAEQLESEWPEDCEVHVAAAELRRLYGLSIQLEEELNATERQVEILSDELSKCNKANQKLTGEVAALSANALDDYKAIQELLEALKLITEVGDRAATEIARAAIAKHGGAA